MPYNLPATMPEGDDVQLPVRYEAAKAALAECNDLDECKDWADKAAALASYAKQADDDALHRFADRIRARAVRRAGELLSEFQTGSKGGRPAENGTGGDTVSQRGAAEMAGMSKRQEVTARRVASVPEAEFDALVESDDTTTITALAEKGRRKVTGRDGAGGAPDGFIDATNVGGSIKMFAEDCAKHTPERIAGGHYDYEKPALINETRAVISWLNRFLTLMEA